jgi:hypothetical protein
MNAVGTTEIVSKGEDVKTQELTVEDGALRKIAFEHPALAFFLSGQDRVKRRMVNVTQEHPTITLFLACFTELERQGYIELTASSPASVHRSQEETWAIKNIPQLHRTGIAVELFNCMSHTHAAVQDIVRKFLTRYFQNPWDLWLNIGSGEAKAYGYLTRQIWPKSGIGKWLSLTGVGSDTQTIWVRNELKVRAARQVALVLKSDIDELRRRAPALYRRLRDDIVDAISSSRQPPKGLQRPVWLPQFRRRPAH